MTFYVDNKVDDGIAKPLKQSEIENYEDLFSLQFQMPNYRAANNCQNQTYSHVA